MYRGENVKAQYRGEKHWYDARVESLNSNGTYNLYFFQGQCIFYARDVQRAFIRRGDKEAKPVVVEDKKMVVEEEHVVRKWEVGR